MNPYYGNIPVTRAAFDVHTTTAARVEGLGDVALYAELNDTSDGIGTRIALYELEKEICPHSGSISPTWLHTSIQPNAIYVSGSNIASSKIFQDSTALIPKHN